jgi:hypothetical protein
LFFLGILFRNTHYTLLFEKVRRSERETENAKPGRIPSELREREREKREGESGKCEGEI